MALRFNEKGHITSVTFNHPSGEISVKTPSSNEVLSVRMIREHPCPCCTCSPPTFILNLKEKFVGRYRLVYTNMWGNIPREWIDVTVETKQIKIPFSNFGQRDANYKDYVVQFESSDGSQFVGEI